MIKIKPNIGILGALIRITLGLTVLSCSTAKMVKRPFFQTYFWTALLGAMHVAEGIMRYCPVTALFQQTNMSNPFEKMDGNQKTPKRESSEFGETVPTAK
ncbi:DUF2892 domain-containing protein [Niallia sp. XMNu-256]|uniref:YgaP family membrane protein n=1 Tax=Niallia sp. XMNu-256 TaxID=3082444 RepID=UPI0030CC30A5